MSKTIDDRVVQMEFDNSKFEGNVKTTMSTLEKLKQALNFKGVQDGAEKSASNISVLGSAVQTVGARFSSLEVIGITALTNITNKAINAGEQMLKSLTIEPVSSGFQEYELKMDSIRTIMASTGESLATVNSYLDELNKYSDETIYSFSDMTSNIGKFTNAGVKLDKAVLAIKGVANEAAVSGANANEASRAMYNFAQALSAGYVKLIDWKSIENANMATVEFKQELLNTAEALNTVKKQADGTYKVLTTNAAGSNMKETISATQNFNDSLAYQWMTTEVLTNTLANYADTTTEIGAKAQKAATEVATFSKAIDTLQEAAGSGWAQTWQTIIGDREEATELFTVMVNGISDIIQKSADARNNMAEMVMNSSWEKLSKKITDTGLSLDTFQDRAAEVAKKYGIDVERLIKLDGSFGESLKRGWLNADIFRETLLSLIDGVTGTTGAVLSADDALTKYSALVKSIIRGDYGNGEARVKALTAAGYDYAAVQALVNKVCYGGTLTVEDMTDSLLKMSDAELESAGLTKEQVEALRALEIEAKYSNTSVSELIDNLTKPSGRELLFSTMEHSISALKKSMDAIRKAWKNVFPTQMVSQGIYNALAAVEKFSEKLDFTDTTGKKITATFQGLFNILDLIRMVVGGGIGLAFRVLKQVMANLNINVLDLTASAGEAITKFHDWVVENSFIADGITLVADAITDAIKMVSKWIAKIKELPQTSSFIGQLVTTLKEAYQNAQVFLSGAVERIGEFIDRLKAMDSISLDNIQTALKDFWTNVVGYFLNVGSIEDKIKSLWNYLQTFISDIRAGGDTAKNAIMGLKDSIVQHLSSFISSIGDKFGIAGETISGFGTKVSEIFGNIKDFLSNIPWGNVAAIAGAIGVLTVIIKAVKKIREMTGVLDLVGDALEAWQTQAKAKKIQAVADLVKSVGIAIAATAASIWVVVDALKKLEGVTLNSDLISKITLVVAVLGSLMAMSKFIGGKTSGFGVLAMAIGIKVLIALFDDIMEIDVDRIMDHLEQLSVVLGMVAALLLVSNLGNWKGGIALLTMSIALTLLLGVVKLASLISEETMEKAISTLEMLGIFIAAFELASLGAKNVLKFSAGIAVLAVAIGMLIADIVLISLLDGTTVAYGIGVLTALMTLVGIMMAFSKMTEKANWKPIIALSAVIATLTACLVLLSLCDPESIKPATICLSALMGMFALMEAASSKTENASLSTIAVMALVVAALGGVLIAVSKWGNPDTIVQATACLSALMAMFALMEFASGKTKNASMEGLLSMAAVVAVLGTVLIAMSRWSDPAALIPSAAALSLLMMAFSAAVLIVSKAKSISTEALGSLTAITLIAALLGVILAKLSQITNPETIMPLALSLSVMLTTFVGTLTVLSVVGPIANGAVAGLEALGLVVTAITAFIVLVGGINELCPDLQTFLDSGITVLNKVASGIGQFVGNLISGVGIGVTDGLPQIGENIKAFTDSLAGVDSSAVDAATSIASVIVALSASSVLDGIAGIFNKLTGSSEGWEDKLASFGVAFKSFADAISDIPDNIVNKTKNVIGAITPLIEIANKIPNSGGWLGKIVGDNDIDDFGEMMESFGGSIAAFAESIQGISDDAVDDAKIVSEVMSHITTIANNVPNSGGWLGKIVGDNDIDDFGEMMESFGGSIAAFAESIQGISDDAVDDAKIVSEVMSHITTIANNVPNSGGWLGKIVGDNDIDDFGEMMESFGGSIAAFAESIQGVDSSAADNAYYTYRVVDNINNCLGELKDSSLPNSWTKYEDAMTGLGDLIDIFVDSFANLNMDTINVAESALAEIGAVYDLSTSMRGNASVPNASVTSNFKSFCSALTVIAPNIHSFVHQMNSTSSTSISTSVSKLKEIVDLASSVKSVDLSALSTLSSSLSSLSSLDFGSDKFQNGGEQFTKGINSMMNAASKSIMTSGTKMSTAMTKVIDSVGKAAQKQAPKFSATGATYALKLASGLSSNGAKVSSGASTVAASGANAASRYYSNYYKAGANLVSGFARGIRDYTYLSVSASKEMAQKALTAAQRILKEHSPSRAMYQVGAYAGEGFANGLTAYNGISYNAGETIANQAINAMRDAVSSVNAVLASDLDNAPTIRPVMDLSDVQSGMSMIGSIFNSNGLASYSSARGVTRMLNSRMRVADTADVINAVRDLKSSIAERPGNTYQINGITYDDGSNIADAVKTIVHAVTTERRI